MSELSDPKATTPLPDAEHGVGVVRRFYLVQAQGPQPGRTWESGSGRCAIGSHPSNDVVIDDPTVSRFHCEIDVDPSGGARVRDLESRNGTLLDGVRVADGYLRNGSMLRIGRAALQFQLGSDQVPLPISERTECGPLVGHSVAMRTVFALLERAAATDTTVLVEGETGTGKEGAAEALHLLSARKDKPLVVVDCGAIPGNLLESELFGHEKGAFTGAVGARSGAFEDAAGGTVFLDEIGELPLDLQPKLLRVLERREIRRLGSSAMQPVDVRVVAATNRDLRTDVNQGRFRPDLYFRLAVLRVQMPPLRARPDDLPLLVERVLARLGAPAEAAAPLRTPEFIAALGRASWPGNVRELRNHLERCLIMRRPLPLEELPAPSPSIAAPMRMGPYAEARRQALDDFERRYLEAVLRKYPGRITEAAEEAGVSRVYLYRLLHRHGVDWT